MHDLDRIQLESMEYDYGGHEATQEQGVGPDSHELQLTSELLEVGSEQELDRFLGDLLSSAAGAAKGFVESPTGQALGGILKQAAGQALPVVGQAIGEYAAPGQGGQVGGQLGTAAGQLLGLELEGLSGEDRDFELARRYVQFARSATQAAARAAASVPAPPRAIAQAAAAQAARRYAPGLVTWLEGPPPMPAPAFDGTGSHAPLTGRWIRRGRHIVVHL